MAEVHLQVLHTLQSWVFRTFLHSHTCVPTMCLLAEEGTIGYVFFYCIPVFTMQVSLDSVEHSSSSAFSCCPDYLPMSCILLSVINKRLLRRLMTSSFAL
ncbi:unnamed protein product [Musa acuminata var. zebrina]